MSESEGLDFVPKERRRHKRILLPRIVPWRDWQEWAEVKDSLYSQQPSLRYHGLLRVAAWRSRGGVPLAVDATAQLVEINMQDTSVLYNISGPQRSYKELQMTYSLAVLRAVNGLVDAGQNKNKYASSVSGLASNIGLPPYLVDLRHQATHNAMPSLHILRMASHSLLDHLRRNYWDGQHQHLIQRQKGIEGELKMCKKLQGEKAKQDRSSGKDEAAIQGSFTSVNSHNLHNNDVDSCMSAFTSIVSFFDTEDATNHPSVPVRDCLNRLTDVTSTSAVSEVLLPLLLDGFCTYSVNWKPKTNNQPAPTPAGVAEPSTPSTPTQGGSKLGLLIPQSASKFPTSSRGLSRCYGRYAPLLLHCCHAWSHFSSALLLQIACRVVDGGRRLEEEDGRARRSTGYTPGSEFLPEGGEREGLEPETQRRALFFLISWAELLLTNGWHVLEQAASQEVAKVSLFRGGEKGSSDQGLKDSAHKGRNRDQQEGEIRQLQLQAHVQKQQMWVCQAASPRLQQAAGYPLREMVRMCLQSPHEWSRKLVQILLPAVGVEGAQSEQRMSVDEANATKQKFLREAEHMLAALPASNKQGASGKRVYGQGRGGGKKRRKKAEMSGGIPEQERDDEQGEGAEVSHAAVGQDEMLSLEALETVCSQRQEESASRAVQSVHPARGGQAETSAKAGTGSQEGSLERREVCPPRGVWLRCTHWQPCPIGVLPPSAGLSQTNSNNRRVGDSTHQSLELPLDFDAPESGAVLVAHSAQQANEAHIPENFEQYLPPPEFSQPALADTENPDDAADHDHEGRFIHCTQNHPTISAEEIQAVSAQIKVL